MDASLRLGQETTLQATTEVIARALAQSPETLSPHGIIAEPASNPNDNHALYCHPLPAPVWADGYNEEWPDLPSATLPSAEQQLHYYCGIYRDELALFFIIKDKQVVYNNPTRSLTENGDRLLITTGSGREYSLTAVAPGSITARYWLNPHTTYRESRINASWVEQGNGYQLEVKMPLSLTKGKLSFALIDESDQGSTRYDLNKNATPWFVYQAPAIKQVLRQFKQQGIRLRLANPQGLLISTTGDPTSANGHEGHWLLRKLYRYILSSNQYTKTAYPNGIDYSERDEVKNALLGTASSRWYKEPGRSNHHLLATAVPVSVDNTTVAVLVAEQSSEQTAALTDQAFSRLFLLSLSVIVITALGLFAYASWLSLRIRRLNKATQMVIDNQDYSSNHYSSSSLNSKANDEIGSLTRNYAELMKRIHEYTEYLQSLSRKLSHELRTPLAIIHSSLDNLNAQTLDDKSQTYQQRAKQGANRLGNILTAMSEARRVEESIEQAEPEIIDIDGLLEEVCQAYQDLYQHHQIILTGINKIGQQLKAVPDLLVQMLDKLIDNATSFCPEHGKVTIDLSTSEQSVTLTVSNDGPLLPTSMQNQLFDPMVSMRDKNDEDMHLGLGLHIVYLIVKYHGGKVSGINKADGSGVSFIIDLPSNV